MTTMLAKSVASANLRLKTGNMSMNPAPQRYPAMRSEKPQAAATWKNSLRHNVGDVHAEIFERPETCFKFKASSKT